MLGYLNAKGETILPGDQNSVSADSEDPWDGVGRPFVATPDGPRLFGSGNVRPVIFFFFHPFSFRRLICKCGFGFAAKSLVESLRLRRSLCSCDDLISSIMTSWSAHRHPSLFDPHQLFSMADLMKIPPSLPRSWMDGWMARLSTVSGAAKNLL